MDKELLNKIRNDSLSKHDGMTRKYGSESIDTCKSVIVNRSFDNTEIQVVFEEHDGYGHGVNVPPDWLNEKHLSTARMACPRCAGAGKLVSYGIDCSECSGTGKIAVDPNRTLQ